MATALPCGWSVQPLEALLTSKRDLTYGIVQPGPETPGGIPIVRVRDIQNGRINASQPLEVAPAVEAKYERSRLRGGELLVTLVGTVGEAAVVGAELVGWNVARAVAVARVRPEIGARWVTWAMRLAASVDLITERVNTTVQTTLNLADLRELPVPVPPIGERAGIAATLGALDDKIESNRRVATSTFDLIDFLARQMVNTNATHAVALSELVEFNRVTLRPGAPDETLFYIDIASVSPGSINEIDRITWDQAPSRARRGVSDGDVIYSTVRPNRRSFAQMLDPDERTVVSTGFAVISPSAAIGSSLITTIARSFDFAAYLESVAHGSAYPAVSIQAMGNYQVEIPTDGAVVAEFESATMPLRRRAHQAEQESMMLAELRDALLPELLSGRIRVPEADIVIGEAVA